jgi:hypothetical protein
MPRKIETQRPRTLTDFGKVSIPGTRVGAVISVGLAIVAFWAIPLARPFILGAILLGPDIGFLLWRKHTR